MMVLLKHRSIDIREIPLKQTKRAVKLTAMNEDPIKMGV